MVVVAPLLVAYPQRAQKPFEGAMETVAAASPWPFTLGESPFKIKGAAYLGILEYFEAAVPGGQKAVLAESKNPDLERFLSQRFLVSSFYDIYPLALVGRHAAKMLGISYHDYAYQTSLVQMQKDVKGVYKLLMKLVSGITAINSLAAVARTYFNFSPAQIEKVDSQHATMLRTQFPLALAEWYLPVAVAYCVGALTGTGAKTIEHNAMLQAEPERQHGVETVTLRIELTWR